MSLSKSEFEVALLEACKVNLKDAGDAENYAKVTLDEMWDSGKKTYIDNDGDECVFEIPARDTHHGRPVLVC